MTLCIALQVYLRKPDLQEATAPSSTAEEEEPAPAASSDQFSSLHGDRSGTTAASEDSEPGGAADGVSLVDGLENDDKAESVAQALRASGNGADPGRGSPEAAGSDADQGLATAAHDNAEAEADADVEAEAEGGSEGGVATASFEWVDDCDSTLCMVVVQKGQQQQELLVSGGITRQELSDLAEDLSAAEAAEAAEASAAGEQEPAQDELSSAAAAAESPSAPGMELDQHSGASVTQPLSPSATSQPEATLDTANGAPATTSLLGSINGVPGSEQVPHVSDAGSHASSVSHQQAEESRTASAPQQLSNEPLNQLVGQQLQPNLLVGQQLQPTGYSLSPTPMLTETGNALPASKELSGQSGSSSATTAGLEDKTVAELKAMCRTNGITGYSGKAKAELVKYIIEQLA